METETDNEMEVARATEMDIEVDVENNSTKVKPKNDTLEHNVPAEEDVDPAMNSCLPDLSKVKNTNYPKPNDKPDIDILLFLLNPSLMIQCQIDYIWKK